MLLLLMGVEGRVGQVGLLAVPAHVVASLHVVLASALAPHCLVTGRLVGLVGRLSLGGHAHRCSEDLIPLTGDRLAALRLCLPGLLGGGVLELVHLGGVDELGLLLVDGLLLDHLLELGLLGGLLLVGELVH